MNAIAARITGIQHIGLPTNDIDATIKFYETLGFEVASTCDLPGDKVAFLKLKNICIETYMGKGEGYAKGFDGAIDMMVGIDNEGNVLGISIINHTETAGLGAVAAAKTSAGEAFRGQFVGTSGTLSVTKDGGTIDAITGATITSRAVCVGVSAAVACAQSLG